jgi:asparagine synthase (glutamine-hydrolysing)
MCGINGIYAYHSASSAPKEAELLATREALRSRGPDGEGAWWSADRRCALGHRRLSIIDLSFRASQPMLSPDGRLAITFNGEIYNYGALRADLQANGVQLRTTSDTEVLLQLYARHGKDMVHRLRGMFAFAIWDAEKRGVFLARDPYGIKPLYTANDGWCFRFASQVKALLAGGQVSHDPEPAGIVGFHLFGSVPEPFTLYRDIRALPAGHTQWIDTVGPREPKSFANLAAAVAEGASQKVRADELRSRVRTAVLDSVRAHLVSDVEVGTFLSAGVDSGALLGLMADAGQRGVRAITLSFEEFRGSDEDEAPLAARVAAHYGAQHVVRRVRETEFQEDLPAILQAMDQPSIDGVNTWFIAKAAREAGRKVAISGLGGDELLAGYPSFVDLPRWRRRFGAIAAIPGLGYLSRGLIRTLAPGFARRQPKALGMFGYTNSWAGAYLLRRGLFLPHELSGFLDRELVREGMRRLKPLRRLSSSLEPDPGSDVGRVCVLESAHYMRTQLLRDADWAGMAHGLEIRVPLVDFTLLRGLAPALPALKPGAGKDALANAPSVPLPREIVARAKTGFAVPTARWMNRTMDATTSVAPSKERTKGLESRDWSRTVFADQIGSPVARAA